jgi:hypothetical protein
MFVWLLLRDEYCASIYVCKRLLTHFDLVAGCCGYLLTSDINPQVLSQLRIFWVYIKHSPILMLFFSLLMRQLNLFSIFLNLFLNLKIPGVFASESHNKNCDAQNYKNSLSHFSLKPRGSSSCFLLNASPSTHQVAARVTKKLRGGRNCAASQKKKILARRVRPANYNSE